MAKLSESQKLWKDNLENHVNALKIKIQNPTDLILDGQYLIIHMLENNDASIACISKYDNIKHFIDYNRRGTYTVIDLDSSQIIIKETK